MKTLRRRLLGAGAGAALALLLAFTQTAPAAELVVGVEGDDYFPLYAVRQGRYSGFARELLDEFAKTYGHRFKYQPMPVPRLFNEFLDKRSLDLKFPDNPNWAPERKKALPIAYSAVALVITEGLVRRIATVGAPIDAVRTVVTIRGFTPTPYLEDLRQGRMTLYETSSAESLLRMVEAGRADAGYMNSIVARYRMRQLGWEPPRLAFDPALASIRNGYCLSSLTHPEVVQQFSEFLKTHQAWMQALKARYEITE